MPELRNLMALAMKARVSGPLMNIPSLEPVLAGSLGDAWPYIADAALAAIEASGRVVVPVEPTEEQLAAAARINHPRDEELYRAFVAARPRDAAPTEESDG